MSTTTDRRDWWIEVAAATLLALATVSSAWCAYEAARWSGVQTIRFSEANASRTEAVAQSNLANQQAAIDVGTWVQWVTATSEGNQRLADFLRARFRSELKVANDAWLATQPLQNPDAPSSPFAMDAYSLAARQEAERLANLADQQTQEAKNANQRSDNYVLFTVIFASVLFFAGVGSKFESRVLRVILVAGGWIIFLTAWGILATFPVQ